MSKLHPFEAADLGRAPFEFVGYEVKVGPIRMGDGFTTIGAPGQPMGVCDYCGQGIAICCQIRSSDDKRFVVGCDCVEKTFLESNDGCSSEADRDPVVRAVQAAKREHARKARHAREEKQMDEDRVWLAANRDLLSSYPHPKASRAEAGETWEDCVDWFFLNAGVTGKLKVIKDAKAFLAVAGEPSKSFQEVRANRQALIAKEEAREAAEKAAAAERAAKAEQDNQWLIEVLEGVHQGDFVESMIRELKRFPLGELSPKCLNILQDIYAKAHGRRNSKKYEEAWNVFEDHIDAFRPAAE